MRLAYGSRDCCPYCYEEISQRQLWFRCTGQLSRDGQRCLPKPDPVLRDRTGFGGDLPPAFAADGRRRGRRPRPIQRGATSCPACRGETSIKICPVCHSRLPVHFGQVSSRLIVPVGAKEAGKTVFMTVLVHELMHQTGQRFNAAISGADDDTRQRFVRDYERPLYRESRLLEPTRGTPDRAPLVFRFTNESQAGLLRSGLFGNREPRRTLLSFFDTAGEDLRSQESIEQNVRYLCAAEGILLMLDPLQLRGARELAAPGTRLPTLDPLNDDPAAVLENVTERLLAGQGKRRSKRISKPLAIVFTKMDAFEHDLKQTSPLLRSPCHEGHFDDRDSLEVHTEIQRLLGRWEGTRIDKFAQLHYRRYRYFGVSALGETPTQDNRVAARGIRPQRVACPLLWILGQFGVIPVKRG